MTQLSRDSFAVGGGLMSIAEGLSLIEARIAAVTGVESVAIAHADGRLLAHDVMAPIALPPFDNSAVDGFAVRHADLSPGGDTMLAVFDRRAAGAAPAPAPPAGTAVRIFTGAPMPPGMDTVFMQEDARVQDGRVVLPAGLPLGANRRLSGEDVARGACAAKAGARLAPQDIGLLAALGLDRVRVRTRLRAAVFSTGDEIVPPGAPLPAAKLYDANRFMVMALLRRLGVAVSDLGILPDDRPTLARALSGAAADHDLILTTGGVSTGEEDHVKAAVTAEGALAFWRLAIKPGRPVAMGTVGGAAFVGLPGNPVAAFVTFVHVVRPLVLRLSGGALAPLAGVPVRAAFGYRKKAGRREYVRVSLVGGEARKHPRDGAGILTSLTETDGLVELGEAVSGVAPGDVVTFLPYAVLR